MYIEFIAIVIAIQVRFEHASFFGYKKEVTVPPSSLMTVVGDNSVPGYVRRLHYPVKLRGAINGEKNEVEIFVKRTMEMRGTCMV